MADVDDIEQQIRRERTALSRNIRELEDRAHAALDWRHQYAEHVAFALGAAFGAGLIFGVATGGEHASGDERPRPSDARQRPFLQTLDPSGRATRQVGELWDDVIGAVIATAGAALVTRLSDLIPGFADQLQPRSDPPRH